MGAKLLGLSADFTEGDLAAEPAWLEGDCLEGARVGGGGGGNVAA
jgi:hypothetical protein